MTTPTRHTSVRQVLVSGQPAAEVEIWQQNYHQRTTTDVLGTRTEGEPSDRDLISRRYYRFPSPKPLEVFGMPVVGQWADMKLPRPNGAVVENLDPATHMDYEAWAEAFHLVYSES